MWMYKKIIIIKKNRYKIDFIVNYNYKAAKHRKSTYIDVYNIIEVIATFVMFSLISESILSNSSF